MRNALTRWEQGAELICPVGDGWMKGLGWTFDRDTDAWPLLWSLEGCEGLHSRNSRVGRRESGRGGTEETKTPQRHWRYYSMFRILKDNSFKGKIMTLCKYEMNACQRFYSSNEGNREMWQPVRMKIQRAVPIGNEKCWNELTDRCKTGLSIEWSSAIFFWYNSVAFLWAGIICVIVNFTQQTEL